jgi:DNA protecting protein DprA
MMSDANLGRFALLFVRGFGQGKVRRTFGQLIPEGLTAREFIQAFAPETPGGEIGPAIERARRLLEESQGAGVRTLPLDAPDYPEPLKRIPDPPPFLHVRGTLPSDWSKAVAVIGTREPSPQALDAAREAVEGMTQDPDAIVVSGLAHGIDNAAHVAALSNDVRTVAVLAHGLHMVYPKANDQLAWRILDEGGCWISEHPYGEPLSKYNLVARDRMQSGLSIATIVIQSSVTGGSMHTALFTLEQSRKLVALEPLARSAEWSGNEYLISRSHDPKGLKKPDRFALFPRPHAMKMSRSAVRQYMAAGLRTSFIPKRDLQEESAAPTLVAMSGSMQVEQQRPDSARTEVPAVVQPVTLRAHGTTNVSPFVTLLWSAAHMVPVDHAERFVVFVRLAPSRGAAHPVPRDVERWHEEGDSDASLEGLESSRLAILLLSNDRFETTTEYKLNRHHRPSAVRIFFSSPLPLRLAVGAAKVAFDALNGEYTIATGASLRPDAVSVRDSEGQQYTSADQPFKRDTRIHERIPPVLASLSALYANATGAGSEEFAALGYYSLLEALLGPVNSGLRQIAQAHDVSIRDLRRAMIRPDIEVFDPALRGKRHPEVLKRFKSLRDNIAHGSLDVSVAAESLGARIVLQTLAEELLASVLSEYAVLRNAGVNDDDLLAILRTPPAGASKNSGKAKTPRKSVQKATMEPLLPSMPSSS